MRQYNRYYDYVNEFTNLVYKYYNQDGLGCLCHYYNLDFSNSVIEQDQLENGTYEFYGNLTGVVYTKILLLPVFFAEPLQPSYIGDEKGYIHEVEGSIVFPTTYTFTPYEHDVVYFPSNLVKDPNVVPPNQCYAVVGIEKSTDTPIAMHKCRIKTAPVNLDIIDQQVSTLLSWFEPAKKILPVDQVQYLTNTIDTSSGILSSINSVVDNSTGIFTITV